MFRRSLLNFSLLAGLQKRTMSGIASKLKPTQKFFEDPSLIFSPQAIMRNFDVIPIVGLIVVAVFCESLAVLRISLTRDDVRYMINHKMACEMIDFDKPRKLRRPPIRKMFVFNQEYVWAPGLLDAIREPTQQELDEMETIRKKKEKEKAKQKK